MQSIHSEHAVTPLRMLVAYSMGSTFAQTTRDYLMALRDFTGFDADFLHVTDKANVQLDLDGYDVVFQNYCARFRYENFLSDSYLEKLRNYRGLKVLAVQDEYEHTNRTKAAILEFGFDVVLTNVAQDSLELVYPKREYAGIEFVTVLTGYVSDFFTVSGRKPRPLSERPIIIGFRGRETGGQTGRVGFEKVEIARRMKAICTEKGIPVDIAWDEESRIYGYGWFDFLESCRATLGSETGSNVMDFDGSLEAAFKSMTVANGGRRPSYEEFAPVIGDREGNVVLAQVSPRVFEYALSRTPMILFRGRYSDCIVPDEHYIALEKDFSNVDDVLKRIEDIPALEAMAERAYTRLVASGAYSYRSFGAQIRSVFERKVAEKGWHRREARAPRSSTAQLRRRNPSSAILAEFPSQILQDRDLLQRKNERVSALTALAHNQMLVAKLGKRVGASLAAARAQLKLFHDMETRAAPPPADAAFARELQAKCDTCARAMTQFEQTKAGLVAALEAPDLVPGGAAHLALEERLDRACASEVLRLVDALPLYEDLLTLNRMIAMRSAAQRGAIGLPAYLMLRARALGALLKAPWRALAGTLIRGPRAGFRLV